MHAEAVTWQAKAGLAPFKSRQQGQAILVVDDGIVPLSDRYHLVAPDYPGFGNSAQPSMDAFDYTFDNLANVMDRFVAALGIKKYSVYLMDYGAPIGFRLAAKHPDRFAWCTSITPPDFKDVDFAAHTIAQFEQDFANGAVACKIGKNIGMRVQRRER